MQKMLKKIWHFLCKNFLIFQKIKIVCDYHHFYKKRNDTQIDVSSEHGIVYLLAPSYSNLGDVAIFVKSIEFLKKYSNLSIKAILYSRQCIKKKNIVNLPLYDDDLIVIQGGGNMGAVYSAEEYLRQDIVKWFPRNKIVSLPQSVWFGKENKNYILNRAKKIYSSHKNLTIFTRDVPSFDFCKKNFKCDIKICPDMVLSATPQRIDKYQKNKKVLLCLRKDIESHLPSDFSKRIEEYLRQNNYSFEHWDTDDLSGRNIENKPERIRQILRYFNQFQFVITDRYHGTILSYISETPCIGLDNSYGKIKNGFVWFKNCNYMFYADNFEQVVSSIGKIEKLAKFQINQNLSKEFESLKDIFTIKNNVRKLYAERIRNNINDSFYADSVSWEGKIKTLRTYAEIIVRFILNKPEEFLLLGKKEKELKRISNNNEVLMNSYSTILKYGDEYVHTEKLTNATENDFNEVLDAIYGMYAYLFINYFEKFGLSSNERTLFMFSLIPPIVRYKTFNYLWKLDKKNSIVIDKLNLAILKTFGIKKAKEWINENAEILKQVSCVSEILKKELIQKFGGQTAKKILNSRPQNMYEVCLSKANDLSKPIEKYGNLYSTYEEAFSFYKNKVQEMITIKPLSEEENIFKEIMDFCYEGRKEFSNDKDISVYNLAELTVISRGLYD